MHCLNQPFKLFQQNILGSCAQNTIALVISCALPSEELRNHEHIALLGLCLSSPSSEAHKIARHLADYVLVWAGGGGKDDVGKSKHMARIANSVYPGHCNEEDCDLYGVFPDGKPSKMMEASLMLGGWQDS